jgi:hypothetical protein
MNTSSVPPKSSAESTFCKETYLLTPISKAEASLSANDLTTADERIARDLNALNTVVPVACLFAGAALVSFPRASAIALMFILSAAAIWFLYSWATCRGNDEIGVADTQGRDGGAT